MTYFRSSVHVICLITLLSCHSVYGQGSKADYENAVNYFDDYRGKIVMPRLTPQWVGKGDSFWYVNELSNGGAEYKLVHSSTGNQRHLFDHKKLADQLSQAVAGHDANPDTLPIRNVSFNEDAAALRFEAFQRRWLYAINDNNLTDEGALIEGTDQSRKQNSKDAAGKKPANRPNAVSPDGLWRAFIKDHNLFIQGIDKDRVIQLSHDGKEGDSYQPKFYWSPDSSRLVCIKTIAGQMRSVNMVDSSPEDQLQPKLMTIGYPKPGDKLPIDKPVLFDLVNGKLISGEHRYSNNPFHIRGIRWRKDSSAFTYQYNQRGHQVYRVIEVDSDSGDTRILINEESDTFIYWQGRINLNYLDATDELVWMSERSGWNHLYLVDWRTGQVKNSITQGQWLVREVIRVDKEKRQVWFWAGGIIEGQDPYHRHLCRVNLDGTGLVVLTSADGEHTAHSFSPNGKYFVTTWSRIDHPPVHELRDADTGQLIRVIAKADISSMLRSGWVMPERFVAKGRDGKTDIWGIVCRPRNFDPNKQYPVIEYIYAGPHDNHVPKSFYALLNMQRTAEIGFIVVQIDGMGTANRSKAFHDFCWKNLKDSGFPDRIAWIKAAAQTRPWMDIERVGIYGGSAGGQSAMRAVLDHADFYDAAAADCGCHDNRIDKIWWNEQWMGWPVDESYIKSSNVVDAHKLGGALLLTVGELDINVDPASTMQVVDALIKANKDFELIVFPGEGHGAGSSLYGQRRMWDFFVRELYDIKPGQ